MHEPFEQAELRFRGKARELAFDFVESFGTHRAATLHFPNGKSTAGGTRAGTAAESLLDSFGCNASVPLLRSFGRFADGF